MQYVKLNNALRLSSKLLSAILLPVLGLSFIWAVLPGRLAAQCTVPFSNCPTEDIIRIDCDNSGDEALSWPLIISKPTAACTGFSIVQTAGPTLPAVAPVGTYLVSYLATATDITSGSQVTATCSFPVKIVKDQQAPIFTYCPPNITIQGSIGPNGSCQAPGVWPRPVVVDNCGPLTMGLSSNLPCGGLLNAGEHTVTYTATDPSGNSSTCAFTVTVVCTSGAADLGKPAYPVRIFPNPNTGTFTLELPSEIPPGLFFTMTDLAGRRVLEFKPQAGGNQQQIDASRIAAGLYFLNCYSEGSLLSTHKIIKQ